MEDYYKQDMKMEVRLRPPAYTKNGVIYHTDAFDIIGKYVGKEYDKYGYCINESTHQTEKDCVNWKNNLCTLVFNSFDDAFKDALRRIK